MSEAALIPLVSILPRQLTAPYRGLIYLGILVTTVAGILHPAAGAALFVGFVLATLTGYSRYLREASLGILILFLAIYCVHPSVLLLILFTVYFQATYYWGGKRSIHYLWIAAVGFVHLAVVATIMSSVVFPVFFVAYVVLLTRALLAADFLAGMTREDGTFDRLELARNEALLIPRFRVVSYWIAGFSILIAIVFFPVLPRVEGLAYQPTQLSQESVSGFSNEVTLGGMGDIQADNRVAMRIFMAKEMTRRIWRWRGATLEKWEFAAQKWTDDAALSDLSAGEDGVELYSEDRLRKWPQYESFKDILGDDVIRFSVASMADPRLFLPEVDGRMPWMVALIRGDFSRISFSYDSWTAEPKGDRHPGSLEYRGFEYEVQLIKDETVADLRPHPEDTRPSLLRRCLSLSSVPESFLSRLEERGEELYPGFKNRDQDPIEVTQQLSAALQRSQVYTLDFSEATSAHSLDEFVFEKKAGNCEYFATTLALLLRSYGIPARLVTGFQSGRESVFGKYLMIRQSDAHSWVEAYIEGNGWMSFDPTPSTGGGALDYFTTRFAFVADGYDFLQMQWNANVLEYSQSDQKLFLGQILEASLFQPGGGRTVRSWFRVARPIIAAVLFIVFLVWLGREVGPDLNPLVQYWSLNLPSFGWLRFRRKSGHMATRMFLQVEKAWAKKGLKRGQGETPKSYLGRVGMAAPDCGEQCQRFEELYNYSRFGVLPDKSQWLHEMRTLTADLLQVSRNGK